MTHDLSRRTDASVLGVAGGETLVSSRDAGWDGLVVEERSLPASEGDRPPMDQHFLCLYMGALTRAGAEGEALRLRQSIDGGRLRERRQTAGEMILLPEGRESRWEWNGLVNVLHLLIEPYLLERAAENIGGESCPVELQDRFGEQDPRLLHLALALREEAREGYPNGKVFADSIANALAIHLVRRYSVSALLPEPEARHGLSREDVRRVTTYVREHLGDALTLAEAAQTVHVSSYHFARLFRAATGQSFHQFVIAERIEEAKRLLARSGSAAPSVAQIAAQVGFSHQSHLALHLRRSTGLSPREFRQQAQR